MNTLQRDKASIAARLLLGAWLGLGSLTGCVAEVESDEAFEEDTFGEVEQGLGEDTPVVSEGFSVREGDLLDDHDEGTVLPFAPHMVEEPPPQPWEPETTPTPPGVDGGGTQKGTK